MVALTVGIVGVLQLGALQQRSQEINTDALVPSNQIAEVRGALLQTRIDALADELLPDAARRRSRARRGGTAGRTSRSRRSSPRLGAVLSRTVSPDAP
jgi:hypothetical protein